MKMGGRTLRKTRTDIEETRTDIEKHTVGRSDGLTDGRTDARNFAHRGRRVFFFVMTHLAFFGFRFNHVSP